MDDYAGRVLADRYRLPLPPSDEYELVETRAFDTYSGQEVLVRQVPLPEVVDAEVLDADGLAGCGGAAPDPGAYDAAAHGPGGAAGHRGGAGGRADSRPPAPGPGLRRLRRGRFALDSERTASPARPLAALLAERPLSPYRAAEVASDVLTALRVLHAHGWTHRNITARTVLVCDDGRVVLTGLASGAAEEALCGYAPVPGPPDEYGGGCRGRPDEPSPDEPRWRPSAGARRTTYADPDDDGPYEASPGAPGRAAGPRDRCGRTSGPRRAGAIAAYRAGAPGRGAAPARTSATGDRPVQAGSDPDWWARRPGEPGPDLDIGRIDDASTTRTTRATDRATAGPAPAAPGWPGHGTTAASRPRTARAPYPAGSGSGRPDRRRRHARHRTAARPSAGGPRAADGRTAPPAPRPRRAVRAATTRTAPGRRRPGPARPRHPRQRHLGRRPRDRRPAAPRPRARTGPGPAVAARRRSRRRPPGTPCAPTPSGSPSRPAPRRPPGAGTRSSRAAPRPAYRGPATPLAAERARQARIAVVGAVTERWAPEQAGPVHENWQLAAPVGPATDLWALGALLYRAVQGHAPYPEESAAELVQLVCAEPPAFAEECGPLRPVVESLLRQDPTERPDFEELRGWLRSLVRSAPEPEAGIGRRAAAVASVDGPAARRTPPGRAGAQAPRRLGRGAVARPPPPATKARGGRAARTRASAGRVALGRTLPRC